MVPVISALMGGLIGCFATIFATRYKAKSDRSKELMALAVQAGIEAFKADRNNHSDSELANRPMSFYIFFHYNFLHLVESGKVSESEIKSINDRQQILLKAVEDGPWKEALSNKEGINTHNE